MLFKRGSISPSSAKSLSIHGRQFTQYAKNSHLNITAVSMIQAVKLVKGSQSNTSIHTVQKGQCLSIFGSISQYTCSENKNTALV